MADLSTGAVFAGHRIEGVAGRGGMGTVYRATHIALDHLVALKVIAADLNSDPSFRERFKSESRIAVSLRHPNVVPIHHAGEEDGLLFVTMDLIDGPDLRKLLIARGALDPEEAVSILEQIASALDVAHSRGLVHRDIKPGNVLIEEHEGGTDHAYLTDFGLTKRIDQGASAALTSTGAFVGTLDYVAPEQIRGGDLDATTDVYALGCVLFEMLTGRPPFSDREEKVAKMYAHLQDPIGTVGGENAIFDDVIARATEKEGEDRYPSAGDLARAAAAALQGRSVQTAERSVATGPAAPTAQHQTPAEPTPMPAAPPGDATVESEPPFDETMPSEPSPALGETKPYESDELPTEAAGAPTEAAGRTTGATRALGHEGGAGDGAGTPARTGARRSKTPLFVAIAAVAALIVIGVVALGGGGGSDEPGSSTAASTPTDNGGGSNGGTTEFDPKVEPGAIPGGDLPVGVAADGNDLFIVDRDGRQVIKADASTMKDVGEPATFDTEPEDAVVLGDTVYVTLPHESTVARLSASDLSDKGKIAIGDGAAYPAGIALGEDDDVWVAGQDDGNVYEIKDGSDSATAFTNTGATAPFGIAASGSSIWIVDREGGRVIQYDPGRNAPVGEPVVVGANPKGVAISDGVVYVANTDDGTVSLISQEGATVQDTVNVDGQPRAVDVLDGHVWVTNGDAEETVNAGDEDGWVSIFDSASKKLVEPKLRVGGSPEGLGVSEDQVFVATGTGGDVKAITP